MPRQNIKVIKVPRRGPIADYPQNFPPMPRLYLELIENKQKVKQDLINKEYVHDEQPLNNPEPPQYSTVNVAETQHHTVSQENYNQETIDPSKLGELRRRDMPMSPTGTDVSDDDLSSYSSGTSGSLSSDSSSDSSLSSDSNSSSGSSDLTIDESFGSGGSDDLSTRLKELLTDGDDMSLHGSRTRQHKEDKYSRHRDKNGYSISHAQGGNEGPVPAPSLAQLQAQGGYIPKPELRDLNYQPANEQQQEDAKREIMFKFDLLKKSYPLSTIPDYTIHTDLNTLQKSYDECVRRLSLDSSVESYKTYLVYGFMGCEFVFGNFLGFDMQGFTQQQIISMHSYEKLLIELGEKSYVPSGSKWPIELRLLFMIIMNAAFFIVSKMMMKKTGANLMGMINNMNTPSQSSSSGPQQRKRKMKGPNIDLSDIPDVADLND